MVKTLLFVFCFLCINTFAQEKQDSVSAKKVKSSWYGRSMPVSIYTGPGYVKDRVNQNIEVGKSFGVVDLGLTYGRINLRSDSNQYLQGRVTMDACQYGIFSNEFTIGGGYIFNSKTPILLEVSYTIFAQVFKNWGIGIATGYYDYSGNVTDFSKNFYGIFLRYGLLRDDGGILMNRGRAHTHLRAHH